MKLQLQNRWLLCGLAVILLCFLFVGCSEKVALKETDTFAATASPTPTPTVPLQLSETPTATESATPTPTPTPDVTAIDNKAAYVNGTTVNMRSEASKDSAILKVLDINKAVTVTGETSDFYRVTVDGTEGFVAKQFITMGKAPTATPKATQKATVKPSSSATATITPPTEDETETESDGIEWHTQIPTDNYFPTDAPTTTTTTTAT